MKKWLALLICCCLLLPLAAQAEPVIIDKVSGLFPQFQFPEDAALLEVYFPKIYGVDAAFVRYGDYSMLIDCGGNQWQETKALLDRLGVTEVTYAVNSHPDADHIGGFNHVAKEIKLDNFVLGFPENYPEGDQVRFKVYEDLHNLGVNFMQVQDGDTIDFGDVKITVYQRTDEFLPRVNNRSVMLMIEYGQRRIFFTGDIQLYTQRLLIDQADSLDLKADIVKFPHHGYKKMQDGFLKMVSPDLVIITFVIHYSCVAKQLREQGIKYFFCEKGILRLATDGNSWTVERLQ